MALNLFDYPTRIKEVSLFCAISFVWQMWIWALPFSVNSSQHIGIFLKKEKKRETLTKVLKPFISTLDISLNSTRSTEKLAKCSWSIRVGFSPDPSGVLTEKGLKPDILTLKPKAADVFSHERDKHFYSSVALQSCICMYTYLGLQALVLM